MSERIIDIHRRSGDATLGQTLVRLAMLAAAAHRFESVGGSGSGSERFSKAVVHSPARTDATLKGTRGHTEVAP